MIAFLLSLIPGPWLAVLKGLPWRLIGWVAAGVVAVWFILMVNGWRLDSNRLQATEKTLEESRAEASQCTADAKAASVAYEAAAGKAKSTEEADKRAAEEVERDLQAKLAASDAGSRDLARRLRDYQARRCSSSVPGPAGAAAVPDAAGGEPAGAGGVDAAVDAYHAACDRDAARMTGWQDWYREVSRNR